MTSVPPRAAADDAHQHARWALIRDPRLLERDAADDGRPGPSREQPARGHRNRGCSHLRGASRSSCSKRRADTHPDYHRGNTVTT